MKGDNDERPLAERRKDIAGWDTPTKLVMLAIWIGIWTFAICVTVLVFTLPFAPLETWLQILGMLKRWMLGWFG